MILDLDEATALKLAVLLRRYERHLHDVYGWALPQDLVKLAESLRHELDRDREGEIRSLTAQRKARQRARERGEDVPFRKSGPAPSRHSGAA